MGFLFVGRLLNLRMLRFLSSLLLIYLVSGMEVPTSNVSSVSNSDGEVSNMIAPVQSMIGDTLILSWVYYDWIYGNYAGEGDISIILD